MLSSLKSLSFYNFRCAGEYNGPTIGRRLQSTTRILGGWNTDFWGQRHGFSHRFFWAEHGLNTDFFRRNQRCQKHGSCQKIQLILANTDQHGLHGFYTDYIFLGKYTDFRGMEHGFVWREHGLNTDLWG